MINDATSSEIGRRSPTHTVVKPDHLPRDFRRHEFGHGRVAHDILRAEAKAHHEAAGDQDRHVGRERRRQRRDSEQQQIELIGEARRP